MNRLKWPKLTLQTYAAIGILALIVLSVIKSSPSIGVENPVNRLGAAVYGKTPVGNAISGNTDKRPNNAVQNENPLTPPLPPPQEQESQVQRRNVAEMSRDLDDKDSELRSALADMEKSIQSFSQRSASFQDVDLVLEMSKRVNSLIIADLESAVDSWKNKVTPALAKYKIDLQMAIPEYQERASEMWRMAKSSKFPSIVDGYVVQARGCEALASYAIERIATIYGDGEEAFERKKIQQSTFLEAALALHRDWKITLEAWPSSFGNDGLLTYLKSIDAQIDNLNRFNASMERLVEQLEKRAPQVPPSESEPQTEPAPEKPAEPEQPTRPVRMVKLTASPQPAPPENSQASTQPKPAHPNSNQVPAQPPPAQPKPAQKPPEQPLFITREIRYVAVNGHLIPQVVTVRHYRR